ncbi:uncharacterized protein TNCV_276291 [Trichonephila clavipes]|nr:uncharacterized protein TNCV_276291 [Trichonephila clavipes]
MPLQEVMGLNVESSSIKLLCYSILTQLGAPIIKVFSTRGLLATDHVILNHGQVTWTTPELAPPLLTTTPHQREDVSALDRFNVHRCPTRRVFSGTGLEPVTKQAPVRYLYHSATAAVHCVSKEVHSRDFGERVLKYLEETNELPGECLPLKNEDWLWD